MDHQKPKIKEEHLPSFTRSLDLALDRLGGKVLYATDDFFAEKENLIKQKSAIFIPDKYTDRGKWMDGWESRRKREAGYDWCIIQLATPGVIKGFDIDTSHFLGNHPPFASIDGIYILNLNNIENWDNGNLDWKELLTKSPLNPGSHNFYPSETDTPFTHIRLNIFPDGGVARLRVYGDVKKDWSIQSSDELINLAAATLGAKAIHCNDMFFSAMDNLILPGRGINMGDGWETKRNRTPNNRDWVIVRLAHPGIIEKILVDTCHFKGNYPDSCSLEACYVEEDDKALKDEVKWESILPKQKLEADKEHFFETQIIPHTKISHVRLNIFPDGGISRLRLFGKKVL